MRSCSRCAQLSACGVIGSYSWWELFHLGWRRSREDGGILVGILPLETEQSGTPADSGHAEDRRSAAHSSMHKKKILHSQLLKDRRDKQGNCSPGQLLISSLGMVQQTAMHLMWVCSKSGTESWTTNWFALDPNSLLYFGSRQEIHKSEFWYNKRPSWTWSDRCNLHWLCCWIRHYHTNWPDMWVGV